MNKRSWGNYPRINNKSFSYSDIDTLNELLRKNSEIIPFGNGRSYGDSALNKILIDNRNFNKIISFDKENGILHVQSGVLLSKILEIYIKKGWFLSITPGTKYITVGGAIASDIHGKNHHIAGCFSESVTEFELMLPNLKIINCSKTKNSELFRATCGGMGLTGIILSAKILLKKIKSKHIIQKTIKTKSLVETFDAFKKYHKSPYSVAWIDCLANDDNLGRCLLMTGDFADDGDLNYIQKPKINIPFYFPSFVLNKFTVKLFNFLYYNRLRKSISIQKVHLEDFFYPLDKVKNWNRIYGKNGFTQYQFILPMNTSYTGLKEILEKISISGKGSFLAVLKLYGKANKNYLSFPMEGYSLALDFKIEPGLFELLDELDKIVIKHNGRIYLSKDVRVNKHNFETGYKYVNKFRLLRKKYNMNMKFNSLQSIRLSI
tara:strand:+ start:3468 stop:4766 length:1299 start_codon:yes stop_codon:yes gene_type:complete